MPESYSQAHFQMSSSDAFRFNARYWFPTFEMLETYRIRYIAYLCRCFAQLFYKEIPVGLSVSRDGCRGFRDGFCDGKFLSSWNSFAAWAQRNDGTTSLAEPRRVLNFLLPALYEPSGLRVSFPQRDALEYCLVYLDETARRGLYARRLIFFDASDPYAYHDALLMDPPDPNRSVASHILHAAVRYYLEIGIREIRTTAGFNIGGLLWPKYGFRPESAAAWSALRDTIRRNFNRLDVDFEKEARALLEIALENPDPRAIWQLKSLARFSGRINGRHGKVNDLILKGTRWRDVLRFDDPDAWNILQTRLARVSLTLPTPTT